MNAVRVVLKESRRLALPRTCIFYGCVGGNSHAHVSDAFYGFRATCNETGLLKCKLLECASPEFVSREYVRSLVHADKEITVNTDKVSALFFQYAYRRACQKQKVTHLTVFLCRP
jgi:hypothetical protein